MSSRTTYQGTIFYPEDLSVEAVAGVIRYVQHRLPAANVETITQTQLTGLNAVLFSYPAVDGESFNRARSVARQAGELVAETGRILPVGHRWLPEPSKLA